MYAFTARFHSFDGSSHSFDGHSHSFDGSGRSTDGAGYPVDADEAPAPPDIALHVRSTAEPDDGLEHVYTEATPFGVYAVLFMNASGAQAAESAAVGVCREALRRRELRGWNFTWQGPERALNAAASW